MQTKRKYTLEDAVREFQKQRAFTLKQKSDTRSELTLQSVFGLPDEQTLQKYVGLGCKVGTYDFVLEVLQRIGNVVDEASNG